MNKNLRIQIKGWGRGTVFFLKILGLVYQF
jgi:hypothetical protein